MNVAILLSGGTGTRVGGKLPKQYMKINDKYVVSYAAEALLKSPHIDVLWIVAEDRWREAIRTDLGDMLHAKKLKGFSDPGDNRQLSIYHAMSDLRAYLKAQLDEETIVVIHDAARPNLKEKLVLQLLEPFADDTGDVDGVMPVLPMKDTVYLCGEGQVTSLLNRNLVYAGQAPEAFRFLKYFQAIERLLPDEVYKVNGSTEPAIVAGLQVKTIPGDETNYKITTIGDLEKFRQDMEGRRLGESV